MPGFSPLTDRDLVQRLLAGDTEAFESFFDEAFPRLFRFALARVGDPQAAEDVAQAALVKAVRKLDTFRGEARLHTWLCTLCRHEIADFWRRAGREPSVSLAEDRPEVMAALESLAHDAETPETRADRRELARRVHVVLDALPDRYAAALEWKYLEGLSLREIAERTGTSAKAVESLLVRARHAFQEAFASFASGGVRP